MERQKAGKLPGVKFIFPNIELRYGIGSPKGSPINFHLLVSPEDPEHIDRTESFLRSLTFKAGPDHETFRCTLDDIVRLGRMHTKNPDLDEQAAFREGAHQFKVAPDDFVDNWANNVWVQSPYHLLIPGG